MSKKRTQTDIGDKINEAKSNFDYLMRKKLLSNKMKLEYLERFDADNYGKILASLANTSTEDGYKNLIKLFCNIAELNLEMGNTKRAIKNEFNEKYKKHLVDGEEEEESDNEGAEYQNSDLEISRQTDYLQCYTDAAVCYQHILSILRDKLEVPLDSLRKGDQLNPYQKLNEVQNQILKFTVLESNVNNRDKVTSIKSSKDADKVAGKETLEILRKYTKNQIDKIETLSKKQDSKSKKRYFTETKTTFEKITDGMKSYLEMLFKTAESIIGTPPCKYSVIGLGSMALKQITPYSDLEFAILTEHEDYKSDSNERKRDYFTNLSHYVNFMVICLGETTIPYSRYNLDMSHLIKVAVNFDLGGKTPLGRIDKDKDYRMIGTVDQLLQYVKLYEKTVDKTLPFILEKATHILGSQELTNEYKNGVSKLLESEDSERKPVHEARAMRLLRDGIIELRQEVDEHTGKQKETKISSDLARLSPDMTVSGGSFEVKQEIYRLPDRFIHNLGSYFNVKSMSGWDVIEELYSRGFLCSNGANNLKIALSFATMIRLRTYDHYEQQKDDLSLCDLSDGAFRVRKETLYDFFSVMLPFYRKLSEFCIKRENLSSSKIKKFFADSEFFPKDDNTRALIYYRLADYNKVMELSNKFQKQMKLSSYKAVDLSIYLGKDEHVDHVLNRIKLGRELSPQTADFQERLAAYYYDKMTSVTLLMNACFNNQDFVLGYSTAVDGIKVANFILTKLKFSSQFFPPIEKDKLVKKEVNGLLLYCKVMKSHALFMLGYKDESNDLLKKLEKDFKNDSELEQNHKSILVRIYTDFVSYFTRTDDSVTAKTYLEKIKELEASCKDHLKIGFNRLFRVYELAEKDAISEKQTKLQLSVQQLRKYLDDHLIEIKKESEQVYLRYDLEVKLAEHNLALAMGEQRKAEKLLKRAKKLFDQVADIVVKNKFLISKLLFEARKDENTDKCIEIIKQFCDFNERSGTKYKINEHLIKCVDQLVKRYIELGNKEFMASLEQSSRNEKWSCYNKAIKSYDSALKLLQSVEDYKGTDEIKQTLFKLQLIHSKYKTKGHDQKALEYKKQLENYKVADLLLSSNDDNSGERLAMGDIDPDHEGS